MRFPLKSCTIEWINLEIGIVMGFAISLLFVMAIEVILKAAEGSAGLANLGGFMILLFYVTIKKCPLATSTNVPQLNLLSRSFRRSDW